MLKGYESMDQMILKEVSRDRTFLKIQMTLKFETEVQTIILKSHNRNELVLHKKYWKQLDDMLDIEFSLVNGPTGQEYLKSGEWELEIFSTNGNIIEVDKYEVPEVILTSKEQEKMNIRNEDKIIIEQYKKDYCLLRYNFQKRKDIYYFLAVFGNRESKKLTILVIDSEKEIYSKRIKNIIPINKKMLKQEIMLVIHRFFKIIFKVKNNRIFFTSDSRKVLTGNLKFIYNEIKSRRLDEIFDIKIMLKDSTSIKRTFKEKILFLYYTATSKKIIIDDYHPIVMAFTYKKEQEIIQVWHATGAFKTVGFSRLGRPGGPKISENTHRKYSATIVNSRTDIPYYSEAFGIPEEKIIVTGIPRNDIFFSDEYKNNIVEILKKRYPQMIGKNQIITFAPTFRGNGKNTATYPFEKIDIEKLGEYAVKTNSLVIIKMHPFVKKMIPIPIKYKEHLVDASKYREVNDFLFVTDILITDYSSVIYEFSLFEKQMIFYAFDLEEYSKDRSFYSSYETFVPGEVAYRFEDVIKLLYNQPEKHEKVKKFKKTNFYYEDSHASQRVVDELILKDTNKLISNQCDQL